MKTATKQQYVKLAECKRQEAEMAMQKAELLMQEAKLYYELAGVPVQEVEVAAKSPQRPTTDMLTNIQPPYGIAPGYIGDFAFLIKALFMLEVFRNSDGTPVSSVDDLANYVGHCFNVVYNDHNYRPTLRGAVLPNNALDFFIRLKNKAEDYKEQVDKRREQ